MTKIQVSIEFNCAGMDEATARSHAKALVEGRGFNVAGTRVIKSPDGSKTFVAKAGHPGSVVIRDGRAYEVWARDGSKYIWVVPVERQDGDAAIYRTGMGMNYVSPHHGDGTHCTGLEDRPRSGPCKHASHQLEAAA